MTGPNPSNQHSKVLDNDNIILIKLLIKITHIYMYTDLLLTIK